MKIKRLLLLPLLLLGGVVSAVADGTKGDPEVLYKYQFALDLQIKLAKGLKLNLEPEMRFNDGYDKLHLNGGLSYKTFGCIYWGATYRLVIDRVESTSSSINSWGSSSHESEIYHRYAFDVAYKDEFARFTPSVRLRYNNFADDEVTDKAYLRYRAKVEYNIRKCRFTPSVSMEAFHDLSEGLISKMRYTAGFDLKTGKRAYLCADYKFDFFLLEYKNAHLFSVGYKIKL